MWTGENVDDFETIAWVSFKDRPPLEAAYHEVRQLLTPNLIVPTGDALQTHADNIVQALANVRRLLIFDNLESVMATGSSAGQFDAGYEPIKILLSRIAIGYTLPE